MLKEESLSVSRLKEILSYEPSTGLFTWKESVNSRASKGSIAGTNRYGYIVITINGFKHRAHRLAWLYTYGEWPSNSIDHINGYRSDNRIANLRDVSNSVNGQNQRLPQSHNKTGLLGIYKHNQCDKYVAQIVVDGKAKYLGIFKDPIEAHNTYLSAKRELHEGCSI